MAHVMKGCIGIRIGGTDKITFSNIDINNIYNFGKNSMKNIEFNNQNSSSAITNIQQETGIEYAGILSIGMILSNCKNITGENINIDKIISNKNQQYEILYNESEGIKIL